MMNPFYIHEPLDKKITYYLIVALLFSLPFAIFYSEVILITLVLHTAIQLRKEKLRTIMSRDLFILQGIFFLTMICTLYSPDKKKAFEYWQIHAAILFLPLLFAANSLDISKYRNNFLRIFSWILTLIILYLYGDALFSIAYFHLPLSNLFYPSFVNHNFSKPLDIHPTYLSMYVAISLIYVSRCLVRKSSLTLKCFYGIQVLVLLAGMVQLGSKSVLLATILIYIVIFITASISLKRKFFLALPSLIIVIIVGAVILKNESFRNKYINDLFEDLQGQVNDLSETDSRLLRWKAATEVIKTSPFIGYGTGIEKQALKEEFFKEKLYNSYLGELDAHNQYLGFWISYGIVGFGLFLYTLYWGTSRAYRAKDPLFLAFMILVITVSISENMLDVNKGIMFYAFFFPLFAGQAGNRKTTPIV